MKWGISVLGLAIAGLVFARAAAAQFATPQIGESENGAQKIKFIESGKPLSDMKWTITRTTQNGKPVIKKELTGEWFKDGAGPITWKEESVFELADGTIRTLSWHKQSSGAEKETFQYDFDWTTRKLHAYYFDGVSGKKKDKTVSLEGDVIWGDAAELMIRGFPFEKGAGSKYTAKIMLEPNIIVSGQIVHRGEETIDTPFGKLPCYKLEMKATGAAAIVVPKTYYWVTKKAPHVQVLKESKENGPLDPRTINALVEYAPAEWVKP